jgi:hypothetical protein
VLEGVEVAGFGAGAGTPAAAAGGDGGRRDEIWWAWHGAFFSRPSGPHLRPPDKGR